MTRFIKKRYPQRGQHAHATIIGSTAAQTND